MSTITKRKTSATPIKCATHETLKTKAANPFPAKMDVKKTAVEANFALDDSQEELTITLNKRLRIICGKSLILIEPDGSITIKGDYLESRATGQNRIRGASISLN